MHASTTADVEAIAATAAAAAHPLAVVEPRVRGAALVAAADAIDAAADELIAIAMRETGLPRPRLQGEVRRTTGQLRLFAEVVADGGYLDVRIDDADPDYVVGPRPDVRRMLEPVGPVLQFSASNFPFAFSVAGGDTAAALAAGCPVIVKAHPGHPELSDATASVLAAALEGAGMPAGVLQLVHGDDAGVALLRDDRIRAAAFTGSARVGRLLADVAAARPRPIPFFGELGSVNPVYATAEAMRLDPDLLPQFLASVGGSAGQLCTKPGFLFVPADADLAAVGDAAGAEPQRLLNDGIGAGFVARRAAVLGAEGVTTLVEGDVRRDDGLAWAAPTIVETTVDALEAAGDALLEESFGPLSIIVRYDDLDALGALHERLFPGNLTATVHAGPDEAERIRPLVDALARTSGRVLFGGWPTGVAVTAAMQHGGPYPATTTDGTSVGTAAIARFLRGVAYQSAPQALLPAPLRDANPWGVPQQRHAAGRSQSWGSLTGA